MFESAIRQNVEFNLISALIQAKTFKSADVNLPYLEDDV